MGIRIVMERLTNKKTSDYIHNRLEKLRKEARNELECGSMMFPASDYELYNIKEKSPDEFRYEKLGQLEDVEDELGIDLITLFKALKNGIWSKGGWYETCCIENEPEFVKPEDIRLGKTTYLESKHKDNLYFSTYEENQLCLFDMDYEDEQHVVKVKDYGKTWALTKEELEK